MMEANKIVLRDSPIFSNNFSPEILKKLVPLIEEFRFTPEEIIFLEGEQDDKAIYFIQNGKVEIFLDII